MRGITFFCTFARIITHNMLDLTDEDRVYKRKNQGYVDGSRCHLNSRHP